MDCYGSSGQPAYQVHWAPWWRSCPRTMGATTIPCLSSMTDYIDYPIAFIFMFFSFLMVQALESALAVRYKWWRLFGASNWTVHNFDMLEKISAALLGQRVDDDGEVISRRSKLRLYCDTSVSPDPSL